jgi:hypothetical protein
MLRGLFLIAAAVAAVAAASPARAHRAQGIAIKDRSSPPAAVGRINGVHLTMRLDTLRYVLRYDRASAHLRGTLNGKPFWAIPLDIVEPGGAFPRAR